MKEREHNYTYRLAEDSKGYFYGCACQTISGYCPFESDREREEFIDYMGYREAQGRW